MQEVQKMKCFSEPELLEIVSRLHEKHGRPVHIADFKEELGIKTKRESVKRSYSETDLVSRILDHLFKKGRIAKSEELARVDNYPVSSYSKNKRKVVTNVRFYAPIKFAGRALSFKIGSKSHKLRFCTKSLPRKGRRVLTKKTIVIRLLERSEKALSSNEIVELLNRYQGLYDISTKRKLYNATSSVHHSVLTPLRKEGLRSQKLGGKYLWFFRDDQLSKFLEDYVKNDVILRTIKDEFRSKSCIPITKLSSVLQLSPNQVAYTFRKFGREIDVRVEVKTDRFEHHVEIEVLGVKGAGLMDWLGFAIPRNDSGYGYETMVINPQSKWKDQMKKEIKKSLSRIHVRTLVGYFYEKLVAKLFNIVCTSSEIQQHMELSRYGIPFIYRKDRVVNVWTTLESGRKIEFDILIDGTFPAFDIMADGKTFLDFKILIESKYSVVTTEHVTYFDEKMRRAFRDRSLIYPIIIGLSWSPDAMVLARRLGIVPLYFSSINRLIRALTGVEYGFRREWERVEDWLNSGKLGLEVLRRQINSLEFRYEFEELLEKRLGKRVTVQNMKSVDRKTSQSITGDEKPEGSFKPMLAYSARGIQEVLRNHPIVSWEYKYDGIRLIVERSKGYVKLFSRNGNELTERHPLIVGALNAIEAKSFILDGELVALDENGAPQPPGGLRKKDPLARYHVFDVIEIDGEELKDRSYEERRRLLEDLIESNDKVSLAERLVSANREEIQLFFEKSLNEGHEGLVAKSLHLPYRSGRDRAWFKLKAEPETLDLVVVGFNWGSGKRADKIGSLLVATREDGKFLSFSRVGTGIGGRSQRALEQKCKSLIVGDKPSNLNSEIEPDLWVRPEVVVEVAHDGVTKSNRYSAGHSLKFPRFVRIREDKGPFDVNSLQSIEEVSQ
jgi:ATP-dependent DNA ligase